MWYFNRNSRQLTKCSTGILKAFGQEGNIFSICCTNGAFLFDVIQVIITVKLCPAPLTNFSASQHFHLIQRWQGIGQIFIGEPGKKHPSLCFHSQHLKKVMDIFSHPLQTPITSSLWYTAHVGFQMLTFLGRLLCWSKLSSDILKPLLQLLLLFSHLLIFWLPWKFLVWNTTPNLITRNMTHTFEPNDRTQDQSSSRSFSTPSL